MTHVSRIEGTTSYQKTYDTVPYNHKGVSMIFCLWFPLHPLLKFVALQDDAQNLEKNNFEWKGRERGQYLYPQTCD